MGAWFLSLLLPHGDAAVRLGMTAALVCFSAVAAAALGRMARIATGHALGLRVTAALGMVVFLAAWLGTA